MKWKHGLPAVLDKDPKEKIREHVSGKIMLCARLGLVHERMAK